MTEHLIHSPPIRVLIADDEPLARRGLELRLAGECGITVVGQTGEGNETLRAVSGLAPDLLFLDVQMPGLDGFSILRALPAAQMPLVVFVTAYDQYAIAAFEANAVDYLLKPISADRLRRTLRRVREMLGRRDAENHRSRLLGLLGTLSGRALTLGEALETDCLPHLRGHDIPLAIRDGGRIIRLSPHAIRWMDAAGDYVCVHTDAETHILRASLGQLEKRLDPNRFPRIHRSTMVNASRVVSLRPHMNGEYYLTLDCGQELKLSRTYRDRLALFK